MSGSVVLVVLFAALLHAVWNAAVKSGGDKFLAAVAMASGSALLAAVALPFLPAPASASWPYLAASMVAQTLYLVLVAATYRAGDMSQTYPLMRGTAPLLVALASGPLVGEALPAGRWLGVGLICLGVLGMAAEGRRRGSGGPAVGLALLNAGVIASYTLIDGLGVRLSGAPASYSLWLFALTAVPLVGWTLARRPRAFWRFLRARPDIAVVGGIATSGSYGLALWAMTMAPVAAVAALRETSILFATAISVLVLGERVSAPRLAAVAVIAAGALTIRLA